MSLQAIHDELRLWSSLGAVPKLWWRDDDAYCERETLQQLRELLAAEPLMLAVVPALLKEDLVRAVEGCAAIEVAQHGWKHLNHADPGPLKSEYPAKRSRVEVMEELSEGQRILQDAFPATFHRVFVPPWHKCAKWVLQEASDLGFDGISLGAPPFPLLKHGYTREANVNVDISDWTRNGRFVGVDLFTQRIIRELRFRRRWSAFDLPVGILSHHARMTRDDFACLRDFIALLRSGGVHWPSLRSLFSARSAIADEKSDQA